METKRLKKALTEVKDKLGLDYALNKGFMSMTCTMKKIDEIYGESATGIYVRWYGNDQDQPPIKLLDKVYINHHFGNENVDFKKSEIVKILSKYYDVVWDYSDKKSILIKEKENREND